MTATTMSTIPPVRLTFLGGASEIGASSTFVEVAGTSILIDCGVRFRAGQNLPDLDALTGRKLDAVVVTHAHSDHTGALAVVHAAFPDAPLYLTPPTLDLVGILQRDALKIMATAPEREAEIPLYAERQVEAMLDAARPVHHAVSVTVGEVAVTFLPASHILGASMVHLQTPGGNVLFTGDYCVTPQRTVPGLTRPTLPVDLVVTETTYGDRLHADRRVAEARLVRTVAEVLEGGGRVLIPAFAIGRAQEVLLILKEALRHKQLPSVPVFIDGMVRAVCGVYARHERYVSRALERELRVAGNPFFTQGMQPVRSPEDRRAVLQAGACVIVSSSGMLQGGPSAFYAAELAANARDAIVITGYQDEESPGGALLDLAAKAPGARKLRLAGREVEVRCRFETYSLSAHADRTQMMGLLEALRPQTVALVHGDREPKAALARSLGCSDVVFAEDGMTLTRGYTSMRKGAPSGPLLDARAARALVGPPTREPLRVEALATAWFGHAPDGATRERFVEALVAHGVVRRHDEDRGLLVSLVAGEARAEAPEDAPEEPATTVTEEAARTLRDENPKGRLVELCAARRWPPPTFEARPTRGGFVARAHVEVPGAGARASGLYAAKQVKQAEQAAASELLEALQSGATTEERVSEPAPRSAPGTRDPRAVLNEMRQNGLIEGYGYELVERRGPAHAQEFVVRGWVEARSGERFWTESVAGQNKKDAESIAAVAMKSLAIEVSG